MPSGAAPLLRLQSPFGNSAVNCCVFPVVKMPSTIIGYPEVAREAMAGHGSRDAPWNGQQEQEQEQESRLGLCVGESAEDPDEPEMP